MVDQTIALGVKPVDIDIGKSLKTAADIQSSQAYTLNTLAESQKKMYDLSREEIGRAAKHLLMMPEGEERNKLYNNYVDNFHKKGYLNNFEKDHWGGKPASNLMLQQLVANSMPVATHAGITGETAGREAAARFPYETRPVGPSESLARPAELQGAPGTGQVGTVGPFRSGNVSVQPMGGTPAPAGTPLPTPAPRGGTASPARRATAAERPDYKEYNEVPKIPVPAAAAREPGIALRGKDPAQIQAENASAKAYEEGIRIPASNASEQRATYSTLRTALDSIKSSKAGPALATISGWMNAAGVDPKTIQAWTGINPETADVMQKSTIQESMKFVRDTIGARESLMAINAIISAFPNLANTSEGNRMMVDIMDELAKWKQDKAKYAGAFIAKNPELDWNAKMDNFNQWWSANKPAEQYVSRVLPRNIPRFQDGTINSEHLQPGTTYMIPAIRGGKPVLNEKGQPTLMPATWDAEAGGFVPKRQ